MSELLVPTCGAWLGVAPGAFSPAPKELALVDFEQKIGASVDIFHAYHTAEDLFPTPAEIALARRPGQRRLLLLNWKPEGDNTWRQVAAGAADDVIDREAAYLQTAYSDPFFLVIHHEPEDEVDPRPGSGFTATDYGQMYRHVVERLRSAGVTNVVYVMNYMGSPEYADTPWFADLYPGDDVVDWIAWDPYACPNPDNPCGDYAEMLNRRYLPDSDYPGFYNWVTREHREKPLMLAEWGVFERPEAPQEKADFLDSMSRQLSFFPRVKALVYFDAQKARRGDTRVDSSGVALDAFRRLASSAVFEQIPP
ncbi:MAG: glycoside hydrolase family 26 protein [Geodermatophilaceae bacterium]